MRSAIGGVIPVLPTPFNSAGAIDDKGFTRVIDASIASGVSAVAMFGLASEYYKLSDSEREHLTELLIRHVAKRCPAIVSIIPHATQLAVAEAIRVEEHGADALMLMPPFFLGTPVADIVRHIHSVASAVSIPVIVQYAPIQTGRAIDAQVFATLCAQLPNISHVKVDLVPSGPTISALSAHGVSSLVGYMGLHLPEDFTRGTCGVMPTVSVAPAMVRIWQLLAEESESARQLHAQLLPFLNFTMQSVEFLIACEKELLVEAGILESALSREPSYKLDSIEHSELQWHKKRLDAWLIHS